MAEADEQTGGTMNEQYAELIITREHIEVLPGRSLPLITFSWQGGKHLPVRIGDAARITPLLPWPVVKLEDDWAINGGIYARRDTGFWWVWHLFAYRVRSFVRIVSYRLILTAMIWGCAKVPDGRSPAWRDVYAVRWLAERLRQQ